MPAMASWNGDVRSKRKLRWVVAHVMSTASVADMDIRQLIVLNTSLLVVIRYL